MTPLFTLLIFSTHSVLAQLLLPSPAFLPPPASSGTRAYNQDTIPNSQWSTLLGNLLYFYEAQRSGHLPNTNRVSWRNDSAVNDGSDVHLDLTGGYYDAGDYIKCTFPLSFSIMSICWGANDFGRGYDLANQTAYLDDMLAGAHPTSRTLYVQVADANLDNAYWGGDLNIPQDRHRIRSMTPGEAVFPGTDAAAGASAAFAACSNLYANRNLGPSFSAPASLQNSSYADILLTHARDLYAFAQTYQTAVPQAGVAYASSSYGDELAMAALLLSWATNSSDYYSQAESYYKQYSLGGTDFVFNWDSKTPGLVVLFAQLANAGAGAGGSFAGNLSGWQVEAERYFDRILNGGGPSFKTNSGLLWYPGDSDDASLNPALNAAMLLTRYAQIATTQEKKKNYLDFAQSQLDYALGNNPMSAPYIVGSNPNSPVNPHSAMASGGNDINHIDTSPPQEAYILYGAVVGGPDRKGRFYDIRSDWPETEVALDYNAPMLSLTAMHVLNDTSDPFFTRLQAGTFAANKPGGKPCDAAFPCHSGLSKGAKVALGVVLSIVGSAIAAAVAYYFYRRRRQRSKY
ncbi:family 9 glycosyl hydrolase [Multifurca ochricompacta]|uniref:Endoglucanase n=1 Tax=Multifurca ochricompacta TaxID=376703 RepID=A0AAD4MB78_9AGAM|nr:family 9 glycosyl hydrolase [Multifurca ochricompacta]